MSHELNLSLPQTGLTLSSRLLLDGAEAAVISLAEAPVGSGHYTNAAALPSLDDGMYSVQFLTDGGDLKGAGLLAWKDGQEVSPVLLARSLRIGTGGKEVLLNVLKDGDPLEAVAVWISQDPQGQNVVAGTLRTDAAGQVRFWLDPGTCYVWKHLTGVSFTNPETITVS
jgi:hypothetical protein